MLDQLLNNGKPVGGIRRPLRLAIAILFLSTNPLGASSQEYVFTAPPEVNRQIVEIPASKTDYPLYECRSETVIKPEKAIEAREATEDNHALDLHDCNYQDSEDKPEESELAPADQP